ncbi:MAG: hypothetical protein MK074_08860, partial [Phycisphaerales bacterium]|nr:hypothetical protein [Phycisphaerales bacterium]
MSALHIVAVDVGHSRTAIAPVAAGTVGTPVAVANTDLSASVTAVAEAMAALPEGEAKPVVVAAVDETAGTTLCSALRDQFGEDVYVIGT